MMLGLILARAGVEVALLEKHADFLRDFRGDTVHASTLDLLDELGLLHRFLAIPHTEAREIYMPMGPGAEFSLKFDRLPARHRFIAFVPQWDLLNMLAEEAARHERFQLLTEAEATGLVREDGRVAGLRYRDAKGRENEIRAELVVGADGRHSAIRRDARLELVETSSLMDVLWFRLSRQPGDPEAVVFRAGDGHVAGLVSRGDYWQIAYVIAKGSAEEMRAAGIEALQRSVIRLEPKLTDRVRELGSWDDVKLLSVRSDRLRRWWLPGLLCIGDAAHAMSPIGGVGINLAIQDAVASANELAGPLREGHVGDAHLERIQRRRELPTRLTQFVQATIQGRLLRPVLEGRERQGPPLPARMLLGVPLLRGLLPRFVGVGFRPEHIRPELAALMLDG